MIFGATVTLLKCDTEEEIAYHVGDDEADIKEGRISVNSPIARGLIDKADDVVVIRTPASGG